MKLATGVPTKLDVINSVNKTDKATESQVTIPTKIAAVSGSNKTQT